MPGVEMANKRPQLWNDLWGLNERGDEKDLGMQDTVG
jgi:hypothetical protein